MPNLVSTCWAFAASVHKLFFTTSRLSSVRSNGIAAIEARRMFNSVMMKEVNLPQTKKQMICSGLPSILCFEASSKYRTEDSCFVVSACS